MGEGNFAGIRRESSRNDPEKCGFAGAVYTDESCLVVLLQVKGDILQDGLGAERLAYILTG
jgi:hypothetical protein